MAERKPFLLRIDASLLEALQRWANDDLRSLNAQMEYLLREALKRAGRSPGGVQQAQGPRSKGQGPSQA